MATRPQVITFYDAPNTTWYAELQSRDAFRVSAPTQAEALGLLVLAKLRRFPMDVIRAEDRDRRSNE